MEFRNFKIDSLTTDKNKMTLSIDLRQSKNFPSSNRFQTESINPKVFIKGIRDNAVVLLNHDRKMVVSNKFKAMETDKGVDVEVELDERNVFATTCMSYRENNMSLGVSFGFTCKEERMKGKHREVLDLEVSEFSVLTVESAYHSSVRSLGSEVSMDDLQAMIDKSIESALEKITQKVEEPKQEELPKEELPKQDPAQNTKETTLEAVNPVDVKVTLEATQIQDVLTSFLNDLKEVVKPVEPKTEEPKQEETPAVEEVKPADGEKAQSDIEYYKKMLADLEKMEVK